MSQATQIFYLGAYPMEPLTERTKGDFEVRVRVHIRSHVAWAGRVEVGGSWGGGAVSSPVQSQIRVPLFAARTLNAAGQSRVTLSLR